MGNYLTQANLLEPQIAHGSTLDNGHYTPIDVPGSQDGGFGTQATAINLAGAVVGVYTDPGGTFHGLLSSDGRIGTVDYSGMPYSEVHMINDRGVLTGGYATDSQGLTAHGYLAFPT